MATKKTLEKWIAESLDDPEKDGKLSLMTLMHFQGATPQVEVHSVKFVDGTNYNPKSLADTFQGKADTDAQNLVGMQSYVILAFYGKSVPESRFPLLIDGDGGARFTGLSTEPPTPTGQLQQGMRLTDGIVKGVFGMLANVQHYQQAFMSQLAAENTNLRRENHDAWSVMKEIMMDQTKLAHEHRMKEMEVRASLEMRQTLMKAAPILTNQLLGKEIFPQSAEDTALIEMLAEHMDPSKVQVMLPMLGIPPAAQGALMRRLNRYMEEKARGEERIKAVTGGNTTAELGFPNANPLPNENDEEDSEDDRAAQ